MPVHVASSPEKFAILCEHKPQPEFRKREREEERHKDRNEMCRLDFEEIDLPMERTRMGQQRFCACVKL